MKTKIIWIIAIILGLVVLFFLPSLLMGRSWLGARSWHHGTGNDG